MTKDLKRILGWLLVAAVIIGSFLFLIFVSQGGKDQNGFIDGPVVLQPVTPNEWIKGNKEAKIELVEYSDFQCPACKSRLPIFEKIINEFSQHIKFVYRHFPLKLNHKNAEIAAKASEAAGLQGKFWEMHDLLFQNQALWSVMNNSQAKDAFLDYAKQLSLNEERFEEDINSDDVEDAVEQDYESGLAAGVNATPTIFLNKVKINPTNIEEFRNLIREAIDKTQPNNPTE